MIQLIDFDSKLFGFPVVKIVSEVLSISELERAIALLKKEKKVKLAYWSSKTKVTDTNKIAELGGWLVDEKVTYVAVLSALDQAVLQSARAKVGEYSDAFPSTSALTEFEALAIQVGEKSRFGQDPNLPKALMEKMYREWIRNSINHRLATHVFMVKQENHIVGMITLGEKNKRGDIGLLAVAENARGRGFSKLLVRAAQAEFAAEGYIESQVVTQRNNLIACHLYESCGYHLESIEYFYHFWIF